MFIEAKDDGSDGECTRTRRYQNVSTLDFIGDRDDGGLEVVVTTGAIRRAKLQSNRHHQQTNSELFTRPDALPTAQPTVSEH